MPPIPVVTPISTFSTPPGTVSLSCSGSTVSTNPLYSWSLIEKPPGAAGAYLTNENTASPTLMGATARGTYIVFLTIADVTGASHPVPYPMQAQTAPYGFTQPLSTAFGVIRVAEESGLVKPGRGEYGWLGNLWNVIDKVGEVGSGSMISAEGSISGSAEVTTGGSYGRVVASATEKIVMIGTEGIDLTAGDPNLADISMTASRYISLTGTEGISLTAGNPNPADIDITAAETVSVSGKNLEFFANTEVDGEVNFYPSKWVNVVGSVNANGIPRVNTDIVAITTGGPEVLLFTKEFLHHNEKAEIRLDVTLVGAYQEDEETGTYYFTVKSGSDPIGTVAGTPTAATMPALTEFSSSAQLKILVVDSTRLLIIISSSSRAGVNTLFSTDSIIYNVANTLLPISVTISFGGNAGLASGVAALTSTLYRSHSQQEVL